MLAMIPIHVCCACEADHKQAWELGSSLQLLGAVMGAANHSYLAKERRHKALYGPAGML